MKNYPTVFIAILAKQKESVLPFFLETIENLDYPKDKIFLHIRTNNNTDNTEVILKQWVDKNAINYKGYHFANSNVDVNIEKYKTHEWNKERFSVLGKIRQDSIDECIEGNYDYYFVVDVDNFIYPNTLKDLIEANQPIVAPLLRYAVARPEFPDRQDVGQDVGPTKARFYSNYHYKVDDHGWFIADPLYYEVLYQNVAGLIDMPCVHCTYLIKKEYLPSLRYLDGSERYEYMVFSKSAKANNIPQYLDNRKIYGVLTLTENIESSMWWFNYLKNPDTQKERSKELLK